MNYRIIPDILIIILVYLYLLHRWSKKPKKKIVIYSIMYLYITLVLYITLMPIIASLPNLFSNSDKHFNTTAFIDYRLGYGRYFLQISLNILMMIPFGFLLPMINQKNIFYTTFYTFIFSLCIEIYQLLIAYNRTADITDIITNTLGSLIGYILYYLSQKYLKKFMYNLKNKHS